MSATFKTSRYNYFIDYNGKILLFNGLTGSGFCMSLREKEKLVEMFDNLQVFQEQYPKDFQKMSDLGYIIDSDLDEVALVKYKNKKITFDNQKCSITINPTVDCNFHCWYCYENHNSSEMSESVKESIKRYAQRVVEEEKVKVFDLSWFGGEPLLYFKEVVFPLSKYIQELCVRNGVKFHNSVTTNGYCIDSEIAKQLSDIKMQSFQITLDGNRERHNKIRNVDGAPSFDRIINNIETICRTINDSVIILRINYDKVTLNFNPGEILDEFSETARSHIVIDLHRVWQTRDNDSDTSIRNKVQCFIDEARSKGFRCSSAGGLSTRKFYNCYVCLDCFKVINYDGNVFKCTARDFIPENSIGKLTPDGTIDWDNSKVYAMYGHSPLESKECQECHLLPLCIGPCPQHYYEDNYDISVSCPWKNENDRKLSDKIIDLYENAIADAKQESLEDTKSNTTITRDQLSI